MPEGPLTQGKRSRSIRKHRVVYVFRIFVWWLNVIDDVLPRGILYCPVCLVLMVLLLINIRCLQYLETQKSDVPCRIGKPTFRSHVKSLVAQKN